MQEKSPFIGLILLKKEKLLTRDMALLKKEKKQIRKHIQNTDFHLKEEHIRAHTKILINTKHGKINTKEIDTKMI